MLSSCMALSSGVVVVTPLSGSCTLSWVVADLEDRSEEERVERVDVEATAAMGILSSVEMDEDGGY